MLPGLRCVVLDADHLKLNKFGSPNEGNYRAVSSNLARIAAQSHQLVHGRRNRESHRKINPPFSPSSIIGANRCERT